MFRILLLTSALSLVACSQTPAPLSTYGASSGAGSSGIHTVSNGDTLYSISKRYRVDLPEITYANKLTAPYRLNVGQRIILPPPEKYEVRSGDSLSSVARLFNVSESRLAELNNILPPYRILTGEVLNIPRLRGLEGEIASVMVTPLAKEAVPAHRTDRSPIKKEVLSPVKREPSSQIQPAVLKQPLPESKPGRFLKPVNGKIISSFGPKAGGLHNDGINIAAKRGESVKAAAEGEVVYAGNGLKGYGNLILIKHGGRYLTAYGHLGQISVKKGQYVKAGESIGTIGTSGQVKDPQLHFEIRKGTEAVNPNKFI